MNLVKWNPSMDLNNWLDDFFNTSISDIIGAEATLTNPAVNIIEETDKFVIEVAAPGKTKSDFNVSVEEDSLIVSSELEEKVDKADDKAKVHRKEFSYHAFKRSFALPDSVDKESVKANYKDGILAISLSKKEEAVDKGPKTIEIS